MMYVRASRCRSKRTQGEKFVALENTPFKEFSVRVLFSCSRV